MLMPFAFKACATSSAVVVFPFEPVIAMMTFGSLSFESTSGQNLRAIFPGRLLPLPTSLPMRYRILHIIIAKSIIIEIPFYEYGRIERGRRASAPLLYSMLGLTQGGRILLYFPVESGYEVLMMYPDKRQRRGFIKVDPDELLFNDFYLSPEGILCALLADEWKANLVWWRMDMLL